MSSFLEYRLLLDFSVLSEGAPSQLKGPSAQVQSTIARVETKFLIPVELRQRALLMFSEKLRSSYLTKSTRYTWIRSVYFDSSSFELFQAHFLSPERRFKLRTRCYAPNGQWELRRQIIELKARENEISVKSRVPVAGKEAERLKRGQTLGSTPRFFAINRALSTLGLTPSCEITYLRHAFEDSDGVRVTVDEHLEWKFLRKIAHSSENLPHSVVESARQLLQRYRERPQVIVEIKHQGAIPPWLNQFLEDLGASRVSFSKYCFAISSELLGSPIRRTSERISA